MNRTERLKERLDALGCACLCEEPMSRHTSFQIGGPAELFVSPSDREQTAAVLAACREQEIPFFLMGNGSNLLVADEGVRGAVIAFGAPMSRIVRQGDALLAQAGATLSQLCRFARQEGLSGLEFAWGIPGSVGGAVRMNAGAYGGETKDVVTRVEALSPEGEPFETDAAGARFGYRTSRFAGGEIVCSAVFPFRRETRRRSMQRWRKRCESASRSSRWIIRARGAHLNVRRKAMPPPSSIPAGSRAFRWAGPE